jgi:hypothetical protein
LASNVNKIYLKRAITQLNAKTGQTRAVATFQGKLRGQTVELKDAEQPNISRDTSIINNIIDVITVYESCLRVKRMTPVNIL